MRIEKLVSGVLITVLATGLSYGAECVWTGAGDGKYWNDDANWANNVKPTNGDTVTISGHNSPIIINDISELTLAGLNISAAKGFSFGDKNETGFAITLNGNSVIESTGSSATNFTSITISEGVNFQFNGAASSIWNADLSGSGSFYKRGAGQLTIQNCDNSKYSGTWYFRNGTVSIYALANALGTGEVNVYGEDKTGHEPNEVSGASLAFRRDADAKGNKLVYANNMHFYYKSVLLSYRGIKLTGDITYSTYSTDEELRLHTVVDGTYVASIDFYGSIKADPNAHASTIRLYTNSPDHYIRFAGPEVDLIDQVFSYYNAGTFYFGSQIKTTNTESYLIYGTNERNFIFEKANVMPAGCYWYLGHAKSSSKFKVDLNGYDQQVGQINSTTLGAQAVAGATCEGELTSERAPATLTIHDPRPTSYRYFFPVNGHLSLHFMYDENMPYRAGTLAFYFTNVCNTTGKIATTGRVQVHIQNKCPNLSELEIASNGLILIYNSVQSHICSLLNVHDLDPTAVDQGGWRTAGYLHVEGSEEDFVIDRVMFNDVDEPAGIYHRQKSGANLTFYAPVWMQSGMGNVRIPEHNMRWVWTGNGDGETITDGANWAAGVAPDLTAGTTVLDFKYGTNSFTVNDNWQIAGIEGEDNTNVYTLGGNGSITITGNENCNANVKLTGALALNYQGSAKMTLCGAESDTTGIINVKSGTLAIASNASLTGNADVIIDNGAVLELAEGVEAKANHLKLSSKWARKGVWGSDEDTATIVNKVSLAGSGTIKALNSAYGTTLSIR